MKFNGEVMFVPVIFGEAGDVTVLGVTALEIFRLTVDAVNQRLVPTRLLWLVYTFFVNDLQDDEMYEKGDVTSAEWGVRGAELESSQKKLNEME